ncbi:unnamed protein product [Protopolystoma xenopodis]|uniref:NADH:ubiquinone reductase (H(+)-translocating) n=1 Tax=Protopolystoma xenopodis TaxID=117903 RepID=A0A3S4ZYR6_9PLAT|nr:unnamed protein product [Protopolystoma xenopodis]
MCGGLSFVSKNCLVFWFCYEASIIRVLFLLYLDSPYSERFVAGWYLIGYSVFSGVPLLLGKLFRSHRDFCYFSIAVYNEDTLGVIGVYRVSSFLFPDVVSLTLYTFFVVLFCILCFFSSLVELDGKRWLAFLRLSHMAVVLLCFVCYSGLGYSAMALFGLSHGMSSGFLFLVVDEMFYILVDASTRHVGFIIKNSNLIRVFLVYLFLSRLIPIILFGFGFIRRMGVDKFKRFMFSRVVSMLSLIVFPLIISLI